MVELPKGVHRVIARGREYLYWAPGRGTAQAAKAIRLPSDPTAPEFWAALRDAQGTSSASQIVTFGDVLDLYISSPQFSRLAKGTRDLYNRQIKLARAAFGDLAADTLRISMIREVVDGLSDRPGAANNFLGTMRAVSRWGLSRDYFAASLTEGVAPYSSDEGHKPWTPKQLEAANGLTGMVRRGYFLARYTGQRGSDVVRLSDAFVDDGGFRLKQQKTGREIWCPIDEHLAAEMATWGHSGGLYLAQTDGRPYTRKRLDIHFAKQRDMIAALAGATLHGLRATRVIELRQWGLTPMQIQDQVGMSAAMIERYCRFADKKASGQASVAALAELRRDRA